VNARFARTFGDSPSDEVLVGLDGWLFYAPAVMQSCIDTPNESRLIDGLNRVDRVMTAVGKNITHVIAPDKASIFSNKLVSEPTCVLRNSEVILNLNTSAMLVSALQATRVAGAENDTAYRRLDTHWTSVGAIPTASALVNSVSPNLWDDDAVVVSYSSDAPGDLARFLGRNATEPETVLAAAPYTPPSASNPLVVDGTTIDGTAHQTDWRSAIAEQTVMLHDSFGGRLVPLVAPYFKDITTIHSVSPRKESLHPTLASSVHIVREQVQRNFFYDVVVNDLAAQFVVAFADKFDIVDVRIVCGDTCSIASMASAAQSAESDFYAIATLRDGVTEAELLVDGVPYQFDTTRPSLGVFMPASVDRIVSGDLELLDWTGRAVTP